MDMPAEFNCFIKISGKEVFKGELEANLSSEEKIDFIISHIKKQFFENETNGGKEQ